MNPFGLRGEQYTTTKTTKKSNLIITKKVL